MSARADRPADAPAVGPGQFLARLTEPPAGVPFTQVLRGPSFVPVRSWFGLALALFGYALVVPLVAQLLQGLLWLLDGRPSSFADWAARAGRYELVQGMVSGHLALACLIPIAILMVRGWHGRPVPYASSVQPGLRWRYLLLCLPLAALVLNAVMWGARIGQETHLSAPAGWQWWMLAILLCSPLQAAGEEYFFRGYLMQAFGSLSTNRWVGVVASALLFALFHGVQNVWLFADRFAFGLLAGALVLMTGGLEASIAAHVANNVFAFSYAVFGGGVAATRALQSIGPAQLVQDLVGFSLVAVVTWWLGRRLHVAALTPSRSI